MARLNELEKTLGPQKGLVNRREAIKGSILRRLNSKLMKKSSQSLAVSAKNIEGKTFDLDAVLKKNEYVLLEFWASWCGPCLSEVPHMKKAYQEFNEKGFEIFSFSLDDDRKHWVERVGTRSCRRGLMSLILKLTTAQPPSNMVCK